MGDKTLVAFRRMVKEIGEGGVGDKTEGKPRKITSERKTISLGAYGYIVAQPPDSSCEETLINMRACL